MPISSIKKSNSRLAIATTLFLASVIASLLISYLASSGAQYWTVREPLPPGVRITSSDLMPVRASLDRKLSGYLETSHSIVGAITHRAIQAGELLRSEAITREDEQLVTESLSLLVRAADIPISTAPGDLVTLYQVFDSRNGEEPIAPIKVLSGLFIRDISRKSANFGSDISLTISLHHSDIPHVLDATSRGRIVVVPAHG